jgi:DNA-binding NarL/FixJ family response regulator
MTKTIRVLLLENNEVEAELISAQLVESLDSSVHKVDSEESFTAALSDFAPDVVLCDPGLTTFNAAAALEVLRGVRPGVPLIVVTGNADERQTIEWLRAGAEDVIPKSNLERLPEAIRAALAARQPLGRLTPRQLQVFRLVCEGHSTPEIARRLQLSAKTVETHRTELMKRLGIHDVVTLVRHAIRLGIVSGLV